MRGLYAHDKQYNNRYQADNHCGRQHGYEQSQEPQISGFWYLIRGILVHVSRHFFYRGSPAVAP